MGVAVGVGVVGCVVVAGGSLVDGVDGACVVGVDGADVPGESALLVGSNCRLNATGGAAPPSSSSYLGTSENKRRLEATTRRTRHLVALLILSYRSD